MNASTEPSIGDLIERRLSRRDALRGLAGPAPRRRSAPVRRRAQAQAAGPSTLTFKELAHTLDETQHVADGYEMQVLIRWGDPVVAGAPAFDPANADGRRAGEAVRLQQRLSRPASAAGRQPQRRPLPDGRQPRIHQHRPDVRRPRQRPRRDAEGRQGAGRDRDGGASAARWSRSRARAAAGRSCRTASTRAASPPTRRCEISGPAAGHDKLKTSADPTGTQVLGTFNNCAGGEHAVGHVADLRGELQLLLRRRCGASIADAEARQALRHRPRATYAWGQHFDRFNFDKEPNEPNRFGWVVEIDPYDPQSPPVKRTALGRFKHEGCTTRWPRTAASSSTGRRRALRVRLQVRHVEAVEPERPRRQPQPAGRGHALRRALRRRRQGRVAAAGARPGAADGGERLRQPGRRADQDPPGRRSPEGRRRWTGRRTSRPIRSTAASTSC